MQKEKSSLVLGLGLALTQRVLFTLLLACSCVIWLPFILIGESHPKLPLKTVGQGLGLICLACSWLFSKGMAASMFENASVTFQAAFLHTFYGYMAMLSFLPLVGPVFGRIFEEKKRNPFHSEQTQFRQEPKP